MFYYDVTQYGGTEYMARRWHKDILPTLTNIKNYQCYIVPGTLLPLSNIFEDKRDVIIWMHNLPSQFGEMFSLVYNNKKFINEKIKYIVVPSEDAKAKTAKELDIPLEKIWVCNNAIEPFDYNPEKFNNPKQINIVHTSAPDRGMLPLLNAVQHIDVDFRLEIFNPFNPDVSNHFDMQKINKRIRFYGKTPKATVKEHVEKSHIFAYSPHTFIETFCISLAEAMSAGSLPVYNQLGALPEVGNGHGICLDSAGLDEFSHPQVLARHITEAIDKIKSGNWDPTEQIKYINNRFSWDVVAKQWQELDALL